jgi:hypothetical protein
MGLVLLSQIRDFPFRRLLRLAGLRRRYSTPPAHGNAEEILTLKTFKGFKKQVAGETDNN